MNMQNHRALFAEQTEVKTSAVEELAEQLSKARNELQLERLLYEAKMVAAGKETEAMRREVAVMRREFTEAIAQLNELRLRMFHQWTRTDEMLD